MKRTIAFVIAIAAASPSTPTLAQERSPTAILGYGEINCAQWTELQENKEPSARTLRFLVLAWVEGYVTSAAKGSDIAEPKLSSMSNGNAVGHWLQIYCGNHPSYRVANASAAFASHLTHQNAP